MAHSGSIDKISLLQSRIEQAIRVCELYFGQDLPQKQIAQRLAMSTASVCRLLRYARQEGLVKFTISPPLNRGDISDLERDLEEFGIHKIIVAGKTVNSVAEATARYFEDSNSSGSTVVLDGGWTVSCFVDSLTPGMFERMTLVPICADPPSYAVAAQDSVSRLALKYPEKVTCAKQPHLSSKLLAPLHKKIQRRARHANFIVLGVGPWEKGFTAYEFAKCLGLQPRSLHASYPSVVGLCGYCPLDSEGSLIRIRELENKMPRALTFLDIQRMSKSSCCQVVIAAASERKIAVLLAAIKARLCNTLIVDEALGSALVKTIRRS